MNGNDAKECSVPNQLQTYFRDINESSLLSASEEVELSAAIAEGDPEARSRLIQSNLRLVVKIARDYLGRGMTLDDLIGDGNLGLIRAAEMYDPRFGTRFSTYASYWIKQSIRHALINTTSTIRLPAHMFGLLTRWRRAERSLCREQGCPPSFDQVAQCLGLSETQKALVAKAQRARQCRLDSALSEKEGDWAVDDAMERARAPETPLELAEERAELLRRLDRLAPRERQVISLRFALMGEGPMTLKEIGRRLGVTREWVRKIELKALGKLDGATAPNARSTERTVLPRANDRETASKTFRPAAPLAPAIRRHLNTQRQGAVAVAS